MSNKAQATILIIVALLLGAAILGVYYTKEYILKSGWERELEISKEVPPEAEEIYDFTSDCVQRTADYAVDIVGLQGGYISLNHNLYESPLLETPQTKTAIWFFEAPNKIQKVKYPSKEDMAGEISGYIDENIGLCIQGFHDFPEYEIEYQKSKTVSVIAKNQVIVSVSLPLRIKKQDFQFEFKPFYAEVKKPLGYLYEQAMQIFKQEQIENFLEKKTIDLLAAYDDIPFRGSTEDCTAPFWLKSSVIQKLEEYIELNTAFLKIKDTSYTLANPEHKYFEIPAGINDKELNINFLYLKSWPSFIEVFPEKDGILRAESLTESLGPVRSIAESFGCISIMNFIYNINYPVLINLNKDNYNFRFATEVVIDRNEPRINPETPEPVPEIDTRYCKNKLFNIHLELKDESLNPVPNASIKYKCINYLCDLGITNSEGTLDEKTIPCINGELIATKQDYHASKMTTSTNTDLSIEMNLEKYKIINLIPQIQRAGSGELNENEYLIIQMQEPEKEYSISAVYPGQKQIKLIPGNYNMQVYLISEQPEGITISDKEIEFCIDVPEKGPAGLLLQKTKKECKKEKIEGFTANNLVAGSSAGEFAVSAENLQNQNMKIYVPYTGIPSSIEEMYTAKSEFTEPVFEK